MVGRERVGFATHGLEHPNEAFEFARFCLLNHYARNEGFVAELGELASRHRQTLDAVAACGASRGISELADYRSAWGLLSFLTRAPGQAAHPLKAAIDLYRAELSAFATRWGLAANWCAPSLHLALLAPRVFPGNFPEPGEIHTLTPLFTWDLERQGRPPYDTLLAMPRLLLHSDAPGRGVDLVLLRHSQKTVYCDPRIDRCEDSLARVRIVLGSKRLPAAVRQGLLARRREIESAFTAEGYGLRRKPRRLNGQHALARWTYWTYLAIGPRKLRTAEILPLIGHLERDTQHVDWAIRQVLDLLRLPGRRRKLT